MKKIFIALFLLTLTFSTVEVSAKGQDVYYTNLNGVELTEEQYKNLSKVFSEDTIATMTEESINLIKNEKNLKSVEETKYIQIDEYYDVSGKYLTSIEKEVTPLVAELYVTNLNLGISAYADYPTHQTSMKKLTISIVSGASLSVKYVTVTNKWLSLPKIRSFDVIAIRPGKTSMTLNINKDTVSGYQKADNEMIKYNSTSRNTKFVSGTLSSGQGGVGITMNILDAVSSSLENSITVAFICGADSFQAFGTYQHAASVVSFEDSQNYKITDKGLGKVLEFASSVKSKYDGMAGVNKTWTLLGEIGG